VVVDVGVWIAIFCFLTVIDSVAIVVAVFSIVETVVVVVVWIGI
jgi:hypothetical protein